MRETVGIIHLEAKFLYISGSVKLENKVSVTKCNDGVGIAQQL